MGSRRLGRKRLYVLNKAGEELTSTAGAGFEAVIGSQTRRREGELLTTEVTIDLASSKGAAFAFATSGSVGTAGATSVIGLSSSTTDLLSHNAANIMLMNNTASAADSIGILTAAELVCVETPTGGGVHIGLWYGSEASGSGALMDQGGVELIAAQNMALGKDASTVFAGPDVDLDNKYLYLVHSGTAGTMPAGAAYTAGKFVLRLYGYNVFDDV